MPGRPWSATKIVVILAIVVVTIPTCGIGGAVGYNHYRGHLGVKLGERCEYSGTCSGAPCIHDGAGSYCSKLCGGDRDCPSDYVCEPTRSGRRYACMKAGAQDTFGGPPRRTR